MTAFLRFLDLALPSLFKSFWSLRIATGLKRSSTLTIGGTEGFATLGGIINLAIEGNKLRFEINPLAADRAGLKISSKLLNLARIVKEQDQGMNHRHASLSRSGH